MTVKELKEKLNQFPDNLIITIPNQDWSPFGNKPQSIPAKHVSRGCNEADGCVFIDDYEEHEEEQEIF